MLGLAVHTLSCHPVMTEGRRMITLALFLSKQSVATCCIMPSLPGWVKGLAKVPPIVWELYMYYTFFLWMDFLWLSFLAALCCQLYLCIPLCLRSFLASSLCVHPSVSNPHPVRLTETSAFICPTLCLASSTGCLPLPPLLSLFHCPFISPSHISSLNHSLPPQSLHPYALGFTHSSPTICLSSPWSSTRSTFSHTRSCWERGQCNVLPVLHPPAWAEK